MTGRDLIIYILQNDLEDVDLFENEFCNLFLTTEQAAAKMMVGVETAKLWAEINLISSINIGGERYFRNDIEIPTSYTISERRRKSE